MADKQEIKGFVWMDLEMTGLDPRKDKIIEIATLVTDTEFNLLDEEGLSIEIKIEQSDVKLMDEVVLDMHTKNGLIEKCLVSRISQEDAEKQTLEYIKRFFKKWESPLAGNSIWKDRSFLYEHMSSLNDHMHYRVIDPSTIKQLYNIFNPDKKFVKPECSHRALDDIRNSIAEMKYYSDLIF